MIVGERNNGGDLVEKNIRSVSRVVPFKSVWASRGKAIRAQPVVALCEHGDLHVVACLPDLEMEMTTWNPESEEPSPNRLDAMVWGVTECMGGGFKQARIWGSV
jgi:phage terminase large subunit-like protein